MRPLLGSFLNAMISPITSATIADGIASIGMIHPTTAPASRTAKQIPVFMRTSS